MYYSIVWYLLYHLFFVFICVSVFQFKIFSFTLGSCVCSRFFDHCLTAFGKHFKYLFTFLPLVFIWLLYHFPQFSFCHCFFLSLYPQHFCDFCVKNLAEISFVSSRDLFDFVFQRTFSIFPSWPGVRDYKGSLQLQLYAKIFQFSLFHLLRILFFLLLSSPVSVCLSLLLLLLFGGFLFNNKKF